MCEHNPIQVESVYIETVLRSVEHFIERLNSVVSAHDPDGCLDATERPHAKPFADVYQTSALRFFISSL